MKKQAAFTILATMILIPFLVWGGNKIVSHGERISVNETKLELLKEVRNDVKILLRRSK